MQQLTKFEKWVKIRIGEPITALDVTNENVVFGSISGYIGFYNITRNDLKYIQEIFDEIIRGIQIRPDNKAYVSIGDYQGLVLDIEKRDWVPYKYEKRAHNPTVCSSTLAMVRREKVALLTVAPTLAQILTNLVCDISTKKNSLFLVDLDASDMVHYHMEMPPLCVPFDFDGQRILLLEYLRGAKKKLEIFDFTKQTLDMVYEVPANVEFISHGRLVKNYIIYVEDHRKVKCYDLLNKLTTQLFTMDSQIMAFDVLDLDQDQVGVQFGEQKANIGQIQIAAMDYYATIRIWINQKIVQNFNLLKIPNVHPDLIKHRYIFDMGYPYYLKVRDNRLAVSSDLGILVYSL